MKSKIILVLLMLFALPVHAAQNETDVVYRGVDGKLSPTSKQNLHVLKKAARKEGSIKIWIAFEMNFQPNPALRTPEVELAESTVKASLISEIVEPLANDALLLPTPNGLGGAPGCMVKVTEQGIIGLMESEKIRHVSRQP